jgi:hypothetical protein
MAKRLFLWKKPRADQRRPLAGARGSSLSGLKKKRGGKVMPQFSRYEYSSVGLDAHGLKNMR